MFKCTYTVHVLYIHCTCIDTLVLEECCGAGVDRGWMYQCMPNAYDHFAYIRIHVREQCKHIYVYKAAHVQAAKEKCDVNAPSMYMYSCVCVHVCRSICETFVVFLFQRPPV